MHNNESYYSVALILPCWNCEQYLVEMLECLLKQTFQDWQAFFVDDISTDETAKIIKCYAEKDSRIHYVLRDREPKGAPTCRNIGFDLSVGAKYVVYLDADDLIAPYCLQQRVDYMETHQEIEMATFPMKTFEKDIYDGNNFVYGSPFIDDTLQALLNWSLPLVVVTNIYRRESILKYELIWDERVKSLQDSDFNIHTFTTPIKHIYAENAEFDYFYRVGHSGLAKKIQTKEHFYSHLYLIEKVTNEVTNAYDHKYDFALESNIVNFFDIFGKNVALYRRILKVPFVRSRKIFSLKIRLFILLSFHGKKRLWGRYKSYRADINAKWLNLMEEKAEEFRNTKR